MSLSGTLRIAAMLAVAALAGPAIAGPPPQGVTSMELVGTIGPYRVGANLTLQDYTQVTGGHYFYATKLTDIPLTGNVEGGQVEMQRRVLGNAGSFFKNPVIDLDGCRAALKSVLPHFRCRFKQKAPH